MHAGSNHQLGTWSIYEAQKQPSDDAVGFDQLVRNQRLTLRG